MQECACRRWGWWRGAVRRWTLMRGASASPVMTHGPTRYELNAIYPFNMTRCLLIGRTERKVGVRHLEFRVEDLGFRVWC